MKGTNRIIAALLAITLALVFSGCANEANDSQSTADKKEQNETVQTPSEKEAGDEVEKEIKAKREDIVGVAGKVTRVVDGDTLKVTLLDGKEETVRLVLVDTPETKHPQLNVQPFGPEASEYTKSRLNGEEVTLEFDVQERDQYGRLLAYVWVDNELFNQELIAKGLARLAIFPPNTKYVDDFRKGQTKAKKSKKGIWSIENYVEEKGYNTEISTGSAASSSKPSSSQSTEINERCEGKIKGNKNSKVYHVPEGAHYNQTMNNIQWFCSEEEAVEAGYRKSKS
ncbi:thermonuclease family protein [Priestia megaterium]|nr:thermonuclease family protein [Priestia megaterium]